MVLEQNNSSSASTDGRSQQPTQELIFIGTGTSEGIPRISCLTKEVVTCDTCSQAIMPNNPNRRRNTSLLIRYPHPDGRERFIVIDVGKFFWHSAMEWLVKYKIPRIDAIILTHEHFDAVGGLDDLRDWTRTLQMPIPIFLRQSDHATLQTMFPYLTKSTPRPYGSLSENERMGIRVTNATPESLVEKPIYFERVVPDLQFVIIDENTPFKVEGLEFTPLPVLHGGDYVCLGYKFGVKNTVAYISDAKVIPDASRDKVKGVDLLILDCLYIDTNYSHFCKAESIEETRKIAPKKALYIGMNHVLEHYATNESLKVEFSNGPDVELAYDGMRVPIELV